MKKVLFFATLLALSLALAIGVFADTRYSLDGLYINEDHYNSGEYEFGPGAAGTTGEAFSSEMTITQGDKVYCLGWFADTEFSVDRIVYRIDEETEYECADVYRDRTEIYDIREEYGLTWVDELGFERDRFVKSGFGKDDGMMELLGIGDLPAGEYEFELVGKFQEDGEEFVIKTLTLYVEERPLTFRDFNADTDKQYFDQILINGDLKAEGNDAVKELKANVDGSDGSINTIGMYGWFGWVDTETPFGDLLDSYGYIIDDEAFFSKDFTYANTTQDVLDLNGLRYIITVDVSGLQDGETHVIKGCVKLKTGEVVIFNRPDREAVINYKAPLAATPEPTEEPTAEPTSEPTAEPTAEPDPVATDAPNDGPVATDAPSEPSATEKPKNTGCNNVIGGAAAVIVLAAAALFIRKRH